MIFHRLIDAELLCKNEKSIIAVVLSSFKIFKVLHLRAIYLWHKTASQASSYEIMFRYITYWSTLVRYLQKPTSPSARKRDDCHFFNTYFYKKLKEDVLTKVSTSYKLTSLEGYLCRNYLVAYMVVIFSGPSCWLFMFLSADWQGNFICEVQKVVERCRYIWEDIYLFTNSWKVSSAINCVSLSGWIHSCKCKL